MFSLSRKCPAESQRTACGADYSRVAVPSLRDLIYLSDAVPALPRRALQCRRFATLVARARYRFAALLTASSTRSRRASRTPPGRQRYGVDCRYLQKKTGLVGPASSASSWMRLHHSAARLAPRVLLCSSGASPQIERSVRQERPTKASVQAICHASSRFSCRS
jgi:hypothetical protein